LLFRKKSAWPIRHKNHQDYSLNITVLVTLKAAQLAGLCSGSGRIAKHPPGRAANNDSTASEATGRVRQ
jgi:hypothetical protein